MELKSLHFNLAYVFLFSAKQNQELLSKYTHTHIHKVELKTRYFNFDYYKNSVFSIKLLYRDVVIVARSVNQLICDFTSPQLYTK